VMRSARGGAPNTIRACDLCLRSAKFHPTLAFAKVRQPTLFPYDILIQITSCGTKQRYLAISPSAPSCFVVSFWCVSFEVREMPNLTNPPHEKQFTVWCRELEGLWY
jgi:hypothetical protein